MLNACRRQRSVHAAGGVEVLAPDGVLNACRRQRSVHTRRIPCIPSMSRAQRLSASKIGSHQLFRVFNRVAIRCSTPVGVKDRFTRIASVTPFQARVCSTPVGVKDRFTWNCSTISSSSRRAQRLSASKIGSRIVFLREYAPRSRAQRLSASKIGSQMYAFG